MPTINTLETVISNEMGIWVMVFHKYMTLFLVRIEETSELESEIGCLMSHATIYQLDAKTEVPKDDRKSKVR